MKLIITSVIVNIPLIRLLFKMARNKGMFNFTALNIPLEYVITEIQGNLMGLKLNGADQILVDVDDVNFVGE
jgi:hypothetical protein